MMSRKRIHIARITSDKRRRATFTKRRRGLLKKAMELSILCECEVAVFIMAKDETSAYVTNGDAMETVQRALSTNPMVTHNAMYDQLYYGKDDDDESGDDGEVEEVNEEPAGGSLTSKPVAARTKRKRSEIVPVAPASEPTPNKKRTPAPRAATQTPPTRNTRSSAQAVPVAEVSLLHMPIGNTDPGDTSSALLQQMMVLTQLLAQQNRPNGDASSAPGSLPAVDLTAVSTNLLGALKTNVEHMAGSNSSTHDGISSNGLSPNAATAIPSSVASNSPLMPLGELSPGMSGISPHFPFAGLTPPMLTPALTPPALDGSLLDGPLANSPSRDIPSFGDLSGRLGNHKPLTDSEVSQLSASGLAAANANRALNITTAMGPGLGLRVAVPTAPRGLTIPAHLMSSTAPPTSGPIGPHSGTSAKVDHAASNSASNLSGSPLTTLNGLTGTNNEHSSGLPSATNPLDSSKYPSLPPLSSLTAPPGFPSFSAPGASPGVLPSLATPTSGPSSGGSGGAEWPALQSPLVNPSNFMYSPFLYSPRM